MFRKLLNTPLTKARGDSSSLSTPTRDSHSPNPSERHPHPPSSSYATGPVVSTEPAHPSYDQWLRERRDSEKKQVLMVIFSTLLHTHSSISIQKLKSLWQDFTVSKTEKDKLAKLNKALFAFIVLCEQKKVDPKNLTDVFGSNRVFSFNVARRVVKDLKDLWPKQTREQCARLSLQYLSTQGGDACGFELLYVLERLVAHETNLDAMVEAALPSTLARTVHLFFSAPYAILDAASGVAERTFNIIATLTSYPAVADELVRADALYLLFSAMSLECSVQHRRLRDRITVLMLTFIKLHMNTAIATYASNKGIMQNLIFEMAHWTNFSPEQIVTLCRMMLDLARETIPHVRGLLLDDFVSAGGYTFWGHTLLRLETAQPTQEPTQEPTQVPAQSSPSVSRGTRSIQHSTQVTAQPQLLDTMLDIVCDMIYTGPTHLTLSASAESSYGTNTPSTPPHHQTHIAHHEPSIPIPGNTTAPNAIRNIEAFNVLQNYFLQSSQPSSRIRVLDRLLSVYAVNPVNFLLVQHLHTLAHFIEDFENYPIELKEAILRVVLFVVTVVNCVPFQELSALSCLLQDSPSSSTLLLIFHTISKLVNFDPRYKNILRESGLLDMLVKLLKRGYDQIKENAIDPNSKLQLDSYAIVVDCISVLTENVRENLTILRDWGYMDWLMELVTHPTTRPAALRLILHSIKLDTSIENSHGDLASLVGLLQSTPKSACVLKKDILNAVRRAFSLAKITKDLFRETGGFVSLVSVLVGFEGEFTKVGDMNEAMQLLDAVFKTITAAISQHTANRLFFEEQIGYATLTSAITMMGILSTPYAPQVIDCLFDMAFDTSPPHPTASVSVIRIQHSLTAPAWEAQYERSQILNRDAITVILEVLPIAASQELHLEVTRKMNALASASRHNREALSKLGIPHLILTRFREILSENFETIEITDAHEHESIKKRDLQRQLLQLLQTVGNNTLTAAELQEFFKLLQPANAPPILLRTLSQMSNHGYNPSYIEFSNYKYGQGCIHFPSIGDRYWAPANGYTLMFWMFIEKISDDNPVLDLFAIGTEDRKTHLSGHLRGGSLVVNSTWGGSVRIEFPQAQVETGRWAHVAIVHTRGRFRRLQGASEMRVYVDGYARGTHKVHYASSSGSAVGVWLGLTERMVDRADHRMSRAIAALDQVWRLGPAYLIEEPLTSMQVNTVFNLGPTYHANFQGTFAPYQIYEIITSENLEAHLEYGTLMGSLILDKASFSLPEQNIVFAFNASNNQAEGNRHIYIQINSRLQVANVSDHDVSVSIINAADLTGTSKGKMLGGVEAVNRSTVATSLSTVGGISVIFLLIERAETSEALYQSLSILSGAMKYNYKNTHEMDATKGYLIVSFLLKRKAHIINEEILDLLFDLAGITSKSLMGNGLREFSSAQAQSAAKPSLHVPIISNSHVVRNILLYYEIWKGTSADMQKAMLQKLVLLFQDNVQAPFNSYFMRKVHAMNDLFSLLKDDSISEEVYPSVIDVVERICKEKIIEEDVKMITHFLIGALYNAENKKALLYKREQEISTRSIRVCNMVLDMLLRLLVAAPNKNMFYKVISTNWIFFFVDDLLPASTVNLALRIFTALVQHKPSFYTRFKKDGGVRLLERILPSFCGHASVFHTLLCLLLGKPIGHAATVPLQFEFLELFHYFKRDEAGNVAPGAAHEIHAVEASYLLLAMVKRSYEESQMQAAAGLSLSSSTGDIPDNTAGAGLWSSEGQVYASFAAKLASAHPPQSSVPRDAPSPAAAATTVFSFMGSFINKVENKVEQMGREGSRELGGEHSVLNQADNGSPVTSRKKGSVLNLAWRPLSPPHSAGPSTPSTPPPLSRSASAIITPSSSSITTTTSTMITTTTLTTTVTTSSPTSTTAPKNQRPHKIQQSLLKFLMYLFDSSSEFQAACTQLEFMERLIAVAFPNGSLAVSDDDEPTKIDETVSLVFQFVCLIIDVSLKTSLRANTVVELGLEATPLSVTERQLSQYHGKLLRDIMTTLLQSFTRSDFLDSDRERLPANLGRFCHLLVDRCRTNLFPNGARPVFRFFVRLLEKLEGEHVHSAEPAPRPATSGSSLTLGPRGAAGVNVGSGGIPGASRDSDLVPIFKALNRNITLLLSNSAYGSEPDLVLTFNAIIRNQRIVFSPLNMDHEFIHCLCYQLYKFLLADSKIWKILMQTKLDILNEFMVYKTPKGETVDLKASGFDLLMHDSHSFLFWLGDEGTQSSISNVFDEQLKKVWVAARIAEQRATLDIAKHIETRRSTRITRRERKVTADVANHAKIELFRDKNLRVIVDSELAQHRKKRQLESDRIQFVSKLWDSLKDQLTRERAVWGPATLNPLEKWQMDPTEGPYRMRRKTERHKDFYLHYPYYEPNYMEEITRKQGVPPPTSLDSEAYYLMLKAEGKSTQDYYMKPQARISTPLMTVAHAESTVTHENVNGSASPARAASPLIEGLVSFSERSELRDVPSPEYNLHIIENLVNPEDSLAASPAIVPSLNSALSPAILPSLLSPPPSLAVHSSSIPAPLSEDPDETLKDLGSDDDFDDDGVSTNATGSEESSVKDQTEHEEEEEQVGLRIRRRLEPNEHIQSIFNCSSVDGLDKTDGILLFCTSNLYVIDGYCKDPKGTDIIEVEEKANNEWVVDGVVAPPRRISHNSRKWAFEDIREILRRRYLLRSVAIEIFSSDGRNHLVVFSDVAMRDEVFQKMISIISVNSGADASGIAGAQTGDSADSNVRDRLMGTILKKSPLTQKWVNGQISNFQYLMHLNTLAGRSYNDLTQYPVFPWVLQDYDSAELDLTNPAAYRDLSKPMGALTEPRAEKFRERFESWIEESEEEEGKIIPKFHYGTHYSSAAIVLYFLLRLEPFTQHHLKLQSGRWDQADRLFHSLGETWFTCSAGNTGSVMELIPEFYYLPDFLENKDRFNLGIRQTGGEALDDVVLPPWAHGSAREFVRKHRQALESDYVSEHLHEWIDLIFGYKQQGKPAEEALNVYYYLTYEGAVDIDAITDPVQKAATIAQINNFGQTPRQLFDKPHPKRIPPTYLQPFYLHIPIYAMISKEIGEPVGHIRTAGDKLYAMGFNKMPLPPAFNRHIAWSLPDGSVRLCQGDKLVHILENSHNSRITCMATSEDGKICVSGGVDTVVCVYHVRPRNFQLAKRLCGHTRAVTCVAVSRPYSVIVSGSEDHTCIIWDLNTLNYVRQLSGHHDTPVTTAAVHEVTGEILTCSANTVNVWSINGDLLLAAKTSQNPLDFITCSVWSKGPEWLYESVLITGHKDGKIKVWVCTPTHKLPAGSLTPPPTSSSSSTHSTPTTTTMTMTQKTQLTNGLHTSAITALSLSTESQRLYSGDAEGRIVCWAESDLSSKPSRTLPSFNPTDLIFMIKKRGDDSVP